MNIVDKQLCVVADGSHLSDFSRSSVIKSVNNAFRKGIRKGRVMKQSEFICQRFMRRFTEAPTKMKRQQLCSLKRATESNNRLVGLFCRVICRHKLTCRGIDLVEKNIFITTYRDVFVSLLFCYAPVVWIRIKYFIHYSPRRLQHSFAHVHINAICLLT